MINKNYSMKTFLPFSSGADAIVTYYESIEDIVKWFSICWNGLYEQLIKQKNEETIFLEYDSNDGFLYNYYPRFLIEKIV